MTPRPGAYRHRALVVSLIVGTLGVAFAVFLATRGVPSGVEADTTLTGQPAPAIGGRTLLGGRPFRLADERGRYVLVDFFASWCSACLDEAPNLSAFAFAHRDDHHLVLVGVDIEDSAGAGAAFLRETGATWPAVEDVDGPNSIALAYGVPSPPQIWLIGPNGRVIWRVLGSPSASDLATLFGAAERRLS